MIRSARSTVLLLARCGAVAFALTACGYLVVTAQRRANPAPEEAPPTPVADVLPADTTPAHHPPFLPSSKMMVIDGSDALTVEVPDASAYEVEVDDPTFLHGSKSAALPSTVLEGSAALEPKPLPLPPSPGKSSSSSATRVAADGTVTPVEPVFLPSSKARAPLTQTELEALVPGKVTSSRRVFLPSSKSLRIDPVAPKPVPAPAPVDPPKHP